jgi:hypothetical protein
MMRHLYGWNTVRIKQCLLVIFHFVLIGPVVGYLTVVAQLFLHGIFDAVIGLRPAAIAEQITLLITLLLVPIGIIAAYWLGFIPALVVGMLICVIQVSGMPMSWTWAGIVASSASLVGYLLVPAESVIFLVLFLIVPTFVATALCCHLLRRWGMIFWNETPNI